MSQANVVVVDVGLGNLRSVTKAVEVAGREYGIAPTRTSDPDLVRRADAIVVPGQSNFDGFLNALGPELFEVLLERLRAGTPYLGICLGMQILFESSEEAPGFKGLGWFKGPVKKLLGAPGIKIPHMGWNSLELRAGGHPYLDAAGGNGEHVYFVHSFHAVAAEPDVTRATVAYGPNTVTAAVSRDNVFATQFHPEMSQATGIRLLASFLGSLVTR
ncbi:MAG: imidazole glycerol phosphate synthase subunit HisH [Polyangiaceae bacterium]